MDGRKISKIIQSKNDLEIKKFFEQIYQEYFRLLYFISLSYVKNEQVAEDIVQNTFIIFFNKCLKEESISDILNVKKYLCTIARNESYKEKQRIILRESSIDVETLSFEENSLIKEAYLNDLFKQINDQDIELIINHIFLEKSFKEISLETKVPLNSLKSRYRRAILKVRKGLNK